MATARVLSWVCPHCGGDDLTMFYTERRACRVSQDEVGSQETPDPSYEYDEQVEWIGDEVYHCNTRGCRGGSDPVQPLKKEVDVDDTP